MFCIARSTPKRTMFAPRPRRKVFSQVFFKKLAGSQGRALSRSPQRAKFSYRSKNAGEGEFLCLQRKRENPRRGFSLFGSLWFNTGEGKILERIFPSPEPPTFKNFQAGITFFVLYSALDGNLIKIHCFRADNIRPYGCVAVVFYISEEAIMK